MQHLPAYTYAAQGQNKGELVQKILRNSSNYFWIVMCITGDVNNFTRPPYTRRLPFNVLKMSSVKYQMEIVKENSNFAEDYEQKFGPDHFFPNQLENLVFRSSR